MVGPDTNGDKTVHSKTVDWCKVFVVMQLLQIWKEEILDVDVDAFHQALGFARRKLEAVDRADNLYRSLHPDSRNEKRFIGVDIIIASFDGRLLNLLPTHAKDHRSIEEFRIHPRANTEMVCMLRDEFGINASVDTPFRKACTEAAKYYKGLTNPDGCD